MKLVSAKVGPFRSINSPQTVSIDPSVTVFVGMNEAGKTVFLKALCKSLDALQDDSFNPTDDYPRKDYTAYMRRHSSSPEVATRLTYEPNETELNEINQSIGTNLSVGFQFSVEHNYDNGKTIAIWCDEKTVITKLATTHGISTDASEAIKRASSIREAIAKLGAIEKTEADSSLLTNLAARAAKTKWENVVQYEVWVKLSGMIPKFLYFSDYDLLPGKMNLTDLANRLAAAKADTTNAHKQMTPKHKAVLALLRMADVDIQEFSASTSYEELKAKVEAVSISLTDQVLEFWKQNEDLEVEVDIRTDATDEAPFNSGPNIYLRIKNRRHRGVTTPFDQRSRGFIWFFSFLVWFDSVQSQLDPDGESPESLILLLDEPGLALHALAQADFLGYIDSLAENHQVIYTTHSPFMVHSDRLHQVRVVEDKPAIGTVISENLSGSDARTIFPLQAALGWSIAQNLFISKRNLVVEGTSELIYLQVMSTLLDSKNRKGLRPDVTIVPVGGIGNLVTFVSLLNANGLQLAVLHDYDGSSDQKLDDLIRSKLLSGKAVFNVSQFRGSAPIDAGGVPSDIEDLFSPAIYLSYFNTAYSKELGKKSLKETDLPAGNRVVERVERALEKKGIKVRPSGGFNHYLVAASFGRNPPENLDDETMSRFESLFDSVNRILE